MIDLTDALGLLFTDGQDLELDDTAERPFEWQTGKLYVWEETSSQMPIETGPIVREDFVIVAAIAERSSEEAFGRRDRATSLALDAHRDRMLTLVRENQSVGIWADGHIRADSVPAYLRELDLRGIAIRITGWRIIG